MQGKPETLSELLDAALDIPPEAREAWLDSLQLQDEALRSRLRALLSRQARIETSDFLNTLPKVDLGADAGAKARATGTAGDQIGPYRLIREIATGGMGAVWLAERTDGVLKRPVALKFLRAHGPRERLAERLERERDILAGLVHPGIARLYDAGVSGEGFPFLAIEYVEGEHIDKYCRAHSLDLRARLELFLKVARAVAYAHGKLVVHRDLKPANILVSETGQAHLLDFGIAKLLDEGKAFETQLTQIAGRALTPEYASPEQILGEPITIASDIYSLGVLLYELLTDSRPYQLKRDSRGALEEAILEVEPRRPSERVEGPTRRRALRGDLDAIVLKALKKRPDERYATVNTLVDDIERHLAGRPVLAQPDSMAYRLAKFVRRNKWPVAAAALLLTSIVAGAAVAILQKMEADRQRIAADQERDRALLSQRRAEAFSEFMKYLLQDAGPSGQLTATDLLERGTRMLDRQKNMDAVVAAYMRYEISRNYHLFNQIDRELQLLEASEAGARQMGDQSLLAAAQCAATAALMRRDPQLAQAKYAEAEQTLATLNALPPFVAADCLRAQTMVMAADGRIHEAITTLEEGLETLIDDTLPNASRRDLLMTQLSDYYRTADRFADAQRLAEQSLKMIRESGRGDSLVELTAMNNIAVGRARMGEVAKATEQFDQVLAWVEANQLPAMQPVSVRTNVASGLVRLGQAARALELCDTDLVLEKQIDNKVAMGITQLIASRALLQLGRLEESERRLREAEAIWNENPRAYERMFREAAVQRAEIQLAKGNVEGARAIIEPALASLGYPEKLDAAGIDRLARFSSHVHRLAGDAARAEVDATNALEYAKKLAREPQQSADVGLAALLRAEARIDLGKHGPALEDATLAVQALTNGFGAEHADTRTAAALASELKASVAQR